MERRFDVRVPLSNTVLLEQLTAESQQTGIGEARLLVLYASRYVQMSRDVIPLMGEQRGRFAHSASNGHLEGREQVTAPMSSSLDGQSLDTLFGDPD